MLVEVAEVDSRLITAQPSNFLHIIIDMIITIKTVNWNIYPGQSEMPWSRADLGIDQNRLMAGNFARREAALNKILAGSRAKKHMHQRCLSTPCIR
jgi:hypothetical protein